MNYMKEVAQMLGVELEEEFYVKGRSEKYKFNKNGLYFFDEDRQTWLIDFSLMRFLNGQYEIIERPILDEVEKRYLSNVIKPFRNKIEYIAKYIDEDREYISIIYKDLNDKTFSMAFPSYDDDTMYRGMEIGKRYTLEELGL